MIAARTYADMDNTSMPTTPNNTNVSVPMNEFLELKLHQKYNAHQQGMMPAQGQAQGTGMQAVPPQGWPPGSGPLPIAAGSTRNEAKGGFIL